MFYFYWALPTETTFNASTMNVFDENVYSFKINHEEGQIPTLDITIKNPRVGLLNAGRRLDAWFAWDNAGTVQPLFFGRLVGVPSGLFKELVSLQFIARSPTFISDKQALAETLKVAPYYDQFFLDVAHQDDPDSILEGYSALWHTDRLTRATTTSDVLDGEDGTVTFDQNNAFYDSVDLQIGAPPLVNVRVEASVKWTQRFAGYFSVPAVSVASYTGESFMSDWPKAGAGLGGGYTVETSFVDDIYHVAQTPTTNYQSSWTNPDPDKGQCSTESASTQSSGPALLSPNPLSCVLTEYLVSGVCFPDSDPPQNIPAQVSVTGMIVPAWYLSASMTLRYDTERSYSELLAFDVVANVQSILADPTVDQDTELLTINGVDLGKPYLKVTNWTVHKSQSVPIATVIFPNNPTQPGGLAYQIAIQGGVAGATEPTFSDIPGEQTADGSVIWASLGTSAPSDIGNWAAGVGVPVGTIMLITEQTFNPATGNLEDVPGSGSFYMCIRGGVTNANFTVRTYVPPVQTNDEPTPAPRTVSLLPQPTYSTAAGATVSDGSVLWLVLGTNPVSLQVPIGGTANHVVARSYFPTARGQQSVEYLIMRARARLRYRARAITVSWDTQFANCVGLSCRMNATLIDPRLPGSSATGKIIGYSMECDGTTGKIIGHVKIGVSVGLAQSIVTNAGTPEYAAAGYAQTGWQIYDGMTTAPATGDITYTPPAAGTFDDGLVFPLSWRQVSDGGLISGSLASQAAAITASFSAARQLAFTQQFTGSSLSSNSGQGTTTSGITSQDAWAIEEQQLALASQNTPYVMEANPIIWTALLKPCNGNGPFIGSYAVNVTALEVPKGIDLAA
jgi:hypothetical protein